MRSTARRPTRPPWASADAGTSSAGTSRPTRCRRNGSTGRANGARLTLAYAPDLFGGDLLLEAVTEAGRRNSGLARWTRPFGDGPGSFTIAYRYEHGLAELAAPFDAALNDGYVLAPGANATSTVDLGLTWSID